MTAHLDSIKQALTNSEDDLDFSRFDPEVDVVYFQGKRVTNELCEELAEKAERNGPPGLVPGGKSLSGGRKHSPSIQVVLPEQLHAQLADRAAAEGMSVSKWTRRLVQRELSNA